MSAPALDLAAPFLARRRDVGANRCAVEHLHQMGGFAALREGFEEALESAGVAQPPEALPDAVPVAVLLRQSPPGDVVHREIMQGFEELAIIPTLGTPP